MKFRLSETFNIIHDSLDSVTSLVCDKTRKIFFKLFFLTFIYSVINFPLLSIILAASSNHYIFKVLFSFTLISRLAEF